MKTHIYIFKNLKLLFLLLLALADVPTIWGAASSSGAASETIALVGADGNKVEISKNAAQYSGLIRSNLAFKRRADDKEMVSIIELKDYTPDELYVIAKLLELRAQQTPVLSFAAAIKDDAIFQQFSPLDLLQLADYMDFDRSIIVALAKAYAYAFAQEMQRDYVHQIMHKGIPMRDLLQILKPRGILEQEQQTTGLLSSALGQRFSLQEDLLKNVPLTEANQKIILPYITAAYVEQIEQAIDKIPERLRADMRAKRRVAWPIDWLATKRAGVRYLTEQDGSWVKHARCLFSPDGNYLAVITPLSSTQGPTICICRFWRTDTWQPTSIEFEIGKGYSNIQASFSPDARYFAGSSQSVNHWEWAIRVWETDSLLRGNINPIELKEKNGSPAHAGEHLTFHGISDLAFSPDGHYLASASNYGDVKIWQTSDWTGGSIALKDADGALPFKLHSGTQIAFSPDGKLLAAVGSTADSNHVLKIWSAQAWQAGPIAVKKLFNTRPHHNRLVQKIVFSPDSRYLLSNEFSGTINIWDMQGISTGPTELKEPDGSPALDMWTDGIAFSPDGKYMITQGFVLNRGRNHRYSNEDDDFRYPVIKVWQPGNLQAGSLEPVEGIWSQDVQFSPDGKYVLTVAPDAVGVWHVFDSASLPHEQFELVKKASEAWKQNEFYKIETAEDKEIYKALPTQYKNERLFSDREGQIEGLIADLNAINEQFIAVPTKDLTLIDTVLRAYDVFYDLNAQTAKDDAIFDSFINRFAPRSSVWLVLRNNVENLRDNYSIGRAERDAARAEPTSSSSSSSMSGSSTD